MSAKDSSSTVGTSEAPSGACLLEPTVDHTSAPLGLRWCFQKSELKTQAFGESQDHCNGKQRRIALNGKAYNRLQFKQYYGQSWQARWTKLWSTLRAALLSLPKLRSQPATQSMSSLRSPS